eukprot:7500658-Pyramimonas_sp.AAC.1
MLESPNNRRDPIREHIANPLLTSDDCCLRTSRYSYVAYKVTHVLHSDLVETRRAGICPPALHQFLLTWRSRLKMDTQRGEG